MLKIEELEGKLLDYETENRQLKGLRNGGNGDTPTGLRKTKLGGGRGSLAFGKTRQTGMKSIFMKSKSYVRD